MLCKGSYHDFSTKYVSASDGLPSPLYSRQGELPLGPHQGALWPRARITILKGFKTSG